ncbi:MAG: NAD(P)H-dependent oxidoreductase subunit E, partial [Actinomycetota bacterium]|nr:NAD(P)H-dependent oxidoreductase subunit E [Actinomycetota bacterium]
HVNGAASYYADLGFEPRGRRHVRVCAGTACFAASAGDHIRATARELGVEPGRVSDDRSVSLEPVHCLGYCYAAPAALDGEDPCAGPGLSGQLAGTVQRDDPEIPFESVVPDPVILAGVTGSGGDPWEPWRQVLAAGDRARVQREVLASGLRGRGGAGFPAAVKWKAASEMPSRGPRHLICNGDEGDPGSFVDRLLMESDPQRLLTGMALAAYACGATQGHVYVRSEYPRARDALRLAVAAARSAGELGTDVHGSGYSFDVEVFEGAGSYVAGEETALIHSMEGLRGEVQARPPFPTERGLLHEPTVVNNVETLCAVPWIMANGGDAYARMGSGDSKGTKVVCLNERFERPGAYEVELGTSVATIIDECGGGLRDGAELAVLQVGGPLGGFLGPDRLDTPLTFEDLRAAGADLGHGSLVALDRRVDREALYRHFWSFAAAESCGTCVPCRLGTRRGLELAIAEPGASAFAEMPAAMQAMERASLCAFGRSVPPVVRSIERAFGEAPAEGRTRPSTPLGDHA